MKADAFACFYIHRDFVRRTEASAASLHVAEEAAKDDAVAEAPEAADLVIAARDLYLVELDKPDLKAMDFTDARYGKATDIVPLWVEEALAG